MATASNNLSRDLRAEADAVHQDVAAFEQRSRAAAAQVEKDTRTLTIVPALVGSALGIAVLVALMALPH